MPDIQFGSIGEFISMGGYGLYVWSCYAFFAVVVAYNVTQPTLVRKKFFKQQMARMQRDAVRKGEG